MCVGIQVCSYPLRTFAGLFCKVLCLGPFLQTVHLLLALGVPVSVGPCLCASCAVFFSWCCGAPLFRCCCSGLSWWGCRLVFACPRGLGACGLARFLLVPSPSLSPLVVFWCLLVQSVVCWSLPPDIWLYLQRSGCHTSGIACRGCLAPVFTPLHGNKGFGFGPVWGFALSTMWWVLFMCPSLWH